MVKLAADLHIHSCLSPCGEMTMTPNNLVNMAYIKGLELIALSDHNSARNLPAAKAVADARGLLFLPALEVESREEAHILCYMPSVDIAMDFGAEIYKSLPDTPNMPDFFGEQIAMNDDDEPIYTEKKLLVQSTLLSVNDIAALCRSAGGVPVPAHLNRSSNSLIASLGFLPPELNFTTVELYRRLPPPDQDLSRYHVLYSSDAHNLEDILEKESFLSVEEASIPAVLDYLATRKPAF